MAAKWVNKLTCKGFILFQIMACLVCPLCSWADPFAIFQAEVVTDQELDLLRGGFTSTGGLEISFGVEQAVLVDGVLQVATNFNASSLQSILPQQVNNFSSVTMTSDAIRTQVNTVIQNTLDQRVIDSITLINASVKSIDISRQINLLQSLQYQRIHSRQ